ncbi:hypothetical protein G6F35_018740 [Rhizopus arrhizus]|nr:hypothetical protein G6F35_018740 [Rhizopus arrhizus]
MAFRPQEIAAAGGILLDHAFGRQSRQDAVHGRLAHACVARQREQPRAVATRARHAAQHLHGTRDGLRAANRRRAFQHVVSLKFCTGFTDGGFCWSTNWTIVLRLIFHLAPILLIYSG